MNQLFGLQHRNRVSAVHFRLERYAFGVYLELRKALEGLVEE